MGICPATYYCTIFKLMLLKQKSSLFEVFEIPVPYSGIEAIYGEQVSLINPLSLDYYNNSE